MKRPHFVLCALLIAGCIAATAIAYPWLPESVATHWNARGEVDGYSPRWTLFLVSPGIMLGLTLLFAVLPWLSPRRFDVRSFEPTYLFVLVLLVTLMAYVHALILWNAVRGGIDTVPVMLGGVSLFLIAIGNVLGKVRRNFYIGIRTPWTLASERVWYATHRLGAKAFVIGGVIGLVIAFTGLPLWTWVAVIVASAALPLVYSLVLYKRLEKSGELGGEAA